MPALAERLSGLQSRLDALIAAHGVPCATVAVLVGDEIVEAASGVLNTRTGVETTAGNSGAPVRSGSRKAIKPAGAPRRNLWASRVAWRAD